MSTNGQVRGGRLLEVKDLKKHFQIGGGLFRNRQGKTLKAVDGVTFDMQARRNVWAGRRERLRQDDAGPDDRAAVRADRRRDRLRRRRYLQDDARNSCGRCGAACR